jgi:lysophospholipase L1-like esterase
MLFALCALNSESQTFVCGTAHQGTVNLTSESRYTAATAGFDLHTAPVIAAGACSSNKPFFFSVALPEGSYRITVVLGASEASVTTVRAEARRLMLEKIPVAAGKSLKRAFDVSLRVPEIAGDKDRLVKLKPREQGGLDWDHKLTLEFNGEHPGFRSLKIAPVHEPTIYLAGDSTVVDQDVEPWSAWGQMLPRFFRPGVAVANHAESGETVRSFESEQRFAKIFSTIEPGDYLLMQFGHNDQKPVNKVPLDLYKKLLVTYIEKARAAGATPVLVTSMFRRNFDANGKIVDTMAGYPDAMREVAREKGVALIDLNAMSRTLFEAMGPEASLKAFMHYPANAFPNQTEAISDDTHFNSYGAYELARCMVRGIRMARLPVAHMLTRDAGQFDPARPDPQPAFSLPFTPIPLKAGDVTKTPQL